MSSLPAGGPLSHVRDLAPAVAARGIDVTVICADERVAAAFREAGLKAAVVPLQSKFDLRNARRLPALLRGADVVHSHDRRAGLFARTAARMVGARAVHTLHGVPDEIFVLVGRKHPPPPPGVSAARIAWLRIGLMRIEALLAYLGSVVVPSHALATFLVQHGFPRSRLTVIPYGVTVRRIAPPRLHDPPRVAAAAILEQRKGIDVLLDACASMETPAQVEIFGDGSLREELEAKARRLDIPVRFHGFVDDLRDRLLDVDGLVLPTRADNLPMAILEAMAVALPVVATRVGGVPELVVDGVTGYLVEPDHEAELARALDRVIADPSRHRRLGEAGAARVASHFEAGDVADRIVRLYERLTR